VWIAEKFQSNSEIAGSNSYQTQNAVKIPSGVRLREISFVVKRERAQIDS